MRDVKDWNLSDLEELCATKADESSGLEFKRSASLINTSQNKLELCKDVSAMANAAGGVIIYGIADGEYGEASAIDAGSDPSITSSEWIDQVLTTGIEPKVIGVTITSIILANSNKAFAISIPQATTFAPHQVRERKQYFRRTGSRVEAMFDYEVRDLMRRSSTPSLHMKLEVYGKGDVFFLRGTISNDSSEPALYSMLQIALDNDLAVASIAFFEKSDVEILMTGGKTSRATMFTRKMGVPTHFPVFKEAIWILFEVEVQIKKGMVYPFFYKLSCPGFQGARTGSIVFLGDLPHIESKEGWPQQRAQDG